MLGSRGQTCLVISRVYMDVHICAAHQAVHFLSEHFAHM